MLFSATNLGLAALAFTATLAAPTTSLVERGDKVARLTPDKDGLCGFHVTQWTSWKVKGSSQIYDDYLDVILKDGTGKILWQTNGQKDGRVHATDSEPAIFNGIYKNPIIMRPETRQKKEWYIAFQVGDIAWASNTPAKGAKCTVGGLNTNFSFKQEVVS